MKALATLVAILLALLAQSTLSWLAPAYARTFDPFLLVLVYCGLAGGENHGMLAGAAGGWVQDVHFGGSVVGLSGLTKVLVGFGVGLAGSRFMLTGPAARLLVLFSAALADALLFEGLARLFDVAVRPLGALPLLARGAVNAVLGVALFALLDRRLRAEARP